MTWEVEYAFADGYAATLEAFSDEGKARTRFAELAPRVGWDKDYAWVQLACDGVEQDLVTCESEETGYHPIPHRSL